MTGGASGKTYTTCSTTVSDEKPSPPRPTKTAAAGAPGSSATISVSSTTVQAEGVTATRAEGSVHIGPLPSPTVLQQYHDISPEIVDEIIKAFSKQGENRRSNERWVYKGGVIRSILGVIFAFVLGMTALVGGIYLVLQDYEVAGTVFGGFGIVGLVNAFIQGTRERNKRRREAEDEESE
jgi:uncharacterized membrane protein